MTLEEIQSICNKLPKVTTDIKWESHLCFNIGDKMFLVTAPDYVPVTASFKASDDTFEELSNRPGLEPAPYMARYKWIRTSDINNLSYKEWEQYIDESYQLVKSKLTKKKLKELDLS